MSFLLRAAGLSAAALALASGWTLAAPSVASEAEIKAIGPRFTDHAVAGIDGDQSDSNGLQSTDLPSAAPSALEPIEIHSEAAVAADAKQTLSIDLAPAREERRTLTQLVGDHSGTQTADSEHECLAGAVYFESKGEPLDGQLAVAQVIVNRARSGRFPASICGVVKQRGQFSFIRGGQFPAIARGSTHWRKAVAIAHIAQNELAESSVSNALFFHARHASPGWRLRRIATVGNHVFYR